MDASSRLLSENSGAHAVDNHTMKCPESILIYAFICAVILTIFTLVVFVVSVVYYDKVMVAALAEAGVNIADEGIIFFSSAFLLTTIVKSFSLFS